jgi:hypothetical protein
MTRKTRKYTRLSASAWAELRALWETGNHDLGELSDRYEVSRRALQSHFSKNGSVKGAKAAAMAAVVKEAIFKEELGDQETLTRRAKETREAAYVSAVTVDGLVMAQLAFAQKDPSQAFKVATAIKTLALAAATLERTQSIRLRALGLDKENAPSDEMPVLLIRDLSQDELKALQKRDENDEESELGIPIVPSSTEAGFAAIEIDDSDEIIVEGGEIGDDAIIIEGEESNEPAKPRPKTSIYPGGGRLVKEALS